MAAERVRRVARASGNAIAHAAEAGKFAAFGASAGGLPAILDTFSRPRGRRLDLAVLLASL